MTTNLNDKVINMNDPTTDSNLLGTNTQQHDPTGAVDSIAAPLPTISVPPNSNIANTESINKNGRSTPTETQVKKRTKASRACDQCRKKKIKCDYNELKGICQYCQRNKEKCSFVRVPLKRGPSKGYSRTYKNKNNNANAAASTVTSTNPGQSNDNTIINPNTNNNNNNNNATEAARLAANNAGSSLQNFNQVLLPPLSQYVPQTNNPLDPSNNSNNPIITPVTNNVDVTNSTNNTKGRSSSLNNPNPSGQPNSALNLGQQQFWKVPYHEFPHQKRGSVDSLTSDLSMRNINIQEQLLFSTTQPVTQSNNMVPSNFNANTQNNSSSALENNGNRTPNNGTNNILGSANNSVGEGRANSITGSNNSAYWSYFKNFNPTTTNEEQDIPFRRSSSIPSLLRQTSNSIIMGQQQLPHPTTSQLPQTYPYSQFYQQTTASPQQQTNISSFGHYATTGYHSRNGSVTSDVMSPSALANPLERLVTPSKPMDNSTEANIMNDEKFIGKSSSVTPLDNRKSLASVSVVSQSPKVGSIDSTNNPQKNETDIPTNRSQKRENSVISINSIMGPTDDNTNQNKSIDNDNDNNRNSNLNSKSLSIQQSEQKRLTAGSNIASSSSVGTPVGSIVPPSVVYGQISDVELIDLYYEFIHTGFPIIPLNKQTLTNDILLVNIQPISSIHELNNYVILWFRNSLELLVRLAVQRGKTCSLFASKTSSSFPKHNGSVPSTAGTPGRDHFDMKDDKPSTPNDDLGRNDFFEIQTIFITALNECFQKIVDIHPKFRENKDLISPKIKIIYLSTFIILNYILSYVGYDNSFVLGMSVTIFNEFKLYKMLLADEIPSNVTNADTANSADLECSVVFKRLYILLIVFDSLQSCMFGGPKLLNIPINGTIDKFFDSNEGSEFSKNHDSIYIEKWCVERNPMKLNYIIQSLNLGEFLTEQSINRKSINGFDIEKHDISSLKWNPKSAYMKDNDEPISIAKLFHIVLLSKQNLTNSLMALEEKKLEREKHCMEVVTAIADILTSLISKILDLLTLVLRLNSTNTINPDCRPLDSNNQEQQNSSVSTGSTPTNASDFYQKLLGLNKNKNKDNSKVGIISPFSIPIIYELHNIISIINKLPTHLIRMVMQAEFADTIKPHEVVVRLSNSMNEVVQITNLFNMIKPFKIFDTNLNERTVGEYTDADLIMKRKFMPNTEKHDDNETIEYFIKSGWKLLDDSEFGWL